jgi:spermidine synthase
MNPWTLLDSAQVPGGSGQLRLFQRSDEFSIRVDRHELMNSRAYASEDALSELGCSRVRERSRARVLIGGLGMGYSLRSALTQLQADAEVTVAELVPAIVRWNRELFGHLAQHPIMDPRVRVREDDVARLIAERAAAYDAILLDVDNGPDGLTRAANDKIYSRAGLSSARRALTPRGVLGVWSSSPDDAFVRRLRQTDFDVDQITVRARGKHGGSRHIIWLATPRG